MREKRPMTRRQRAIGRLGLLALVLAAALTLGDYGFTPEGAREASLAYRSMGTAWVLCDIGRLELPGAGDTRGWLMESEKGLLFSLAHFHWRSGWQPAGSILVAAAEEGVYGGALLVEGGEKYGGRKLGQRCFLFGRVTDPEIVRVEMDIRGYTQERWETHMEWEKQDGQSLFLLEPEWEDLSRLYSVEMRGYDERGNEVARSVSEAGDITVVKEEYGGRP